MKSSLLALFLVGCGCGEVNHIDKRTPQGPKVTHWTVIDRAVLKTEVVATPSYGATETASTPHVITYTVAEAKVFTIDFSSVTPDESEDGDTLDLGTIVADGLKVNKLSICGVGEDEKCTTAVIRVYTTATTGHPGISGLVNKTEGYGVDLLVGEGTADQTIGLTDAAAAIAESYTIPANDRKVNKKDFGDTVTYDLEADFSNAGVGDYEATIVIELALGI